LPNSFFPIFESGTAKHERNSIYRCCTSDCHKLARLNCKNMFFEFFVANAFISQVNTQTMYIYKSIAFISLKTWRGSNPGLPFLRRKRCPLRQAHTHVFVLIHDDSRYVQT
jgi:hypothetical protein